MVIVGDQSSSARQFEHGNTHSCTEPREMPKKCRRSAFVKRPLPSAMLFEIDSAARLS